MSAQAKKKLTQHVSKDFPQIILSWFQLIFSSFSTQNIFQIRACLISAKSKTSQANGLQVAPKILHNFPPPPPPSSGHFNGPSLSRRSLQAQVSFSRVRIPHVLMIKTESIKKLSNFYFQWTKTLYQNNLNHIAFFFTFLKGYRYN